MNLVTVRDKLIACLRVFRSSLLAIAAIRTVVNNEHIHIAGFLRPPRRHLTQALIILQYFKIPYSNYVCNSISITAGNCDLSFNLLNAKSCGDSWHFVF